MNIYVISRRFCKMLILFYESDYHMFQNNKTLQHYSIVLSLTSTLCLVRNLWMYVTVLICKKETNEFHITRKDTDASLQYADTPSSRLIQICAVQNLLRISFVIIDICDHVFYGYETFKCNILPYIMHIKPVSQNIHFDMTHMTLNRFLSCDMSLCTRICLIQFWTQQRVRFRLKQTSTDERITGYAVLRLWRKILVSRNIFW